MPGVKDGKDATGDARIWIGIGLHFRKIVYPVVVADVSDDSDISIILYSLSKTKRKGYKDSIRENLSDLSELSVDGCKQSSDYLSGIIEYEKAQ